MAAPLVPRDWEEGSTQEGAVVEEEDRWARLLPELLAEVLRLVEASGGERWPARKDVVSCACVCRRWRDVAATVVRPLPESGKITFLASLKQPGPKDFPIQCFIKRNNKNSMFYLYLGLTNSLIFGERTSKYMTVSHPMMAQWRQALDLFSALEVGESAPKYRWETLMLGRFPTNTTCLNPEGLGGCFAP